MCIRDSLKTSNRLISKNYSFLILSCKLVSISMFVTICIITEIFDNKIIILQSSRNCLSSWKLIVNHSSLNQSCVKRSLIRVNLYKHKHFRFLFKRSTMYLFLKILFSPSCAEKNTLRIFISMRFYLYWISFTLMGIFVNK